MSKKECKKILIVDDEKDNRELLKMLLKKEDYEVFEASSGYEAIKEVKKIFFSVILLDIRMPGMDGIKVLEKLQEESPQSQVIILTAYRNSDNVKRARELGVFDVIDKSPDNNDLLLLRVESAFKHADAVQKKEQEEKKILRHITIKIYWETIQR